MDKYFEKFLNKVYLVKKNVPTVEKPFAPDQKEYLE